MPRGYFDAITLFPPPGQTDGGDVTLYACGVDPNGVLSANVGDFAWQVGTGVMWTCLGSSTWSQAPSDVPTASRVYFRWQPGGEADDQATGTYLAWDDVHAAAAAAVAAGNVATIIVDDSITSPATTVAGTYDMTDIVLIGSYGLGGGADIQTVMLTVDNTVFTNWGAGISYLSISNGGAEALFTVPAEDAWNFTLGYRSELVSGNAPVIDVALSSGNLTINALHQVGLGNATNEVLSVAAGKTATITSAGTIVVTATVFSGAGNVTVTSPSVFSSVSATQAGLGGTLTLNLPDADLIPYTPADGADWVDPDPTTVQAALDRIAAAVQGLLAAPIP